MVSIGEQIRGQVMQMPNVSALPHRYGGVEFRVNGREIGHIHGSHMADLPFPVRVRKQLVTEGRASLHHLLPDTGWVSYYIKGEQDIQRVVELFQLNYEIITSKRRKVASNTDNA